MKNLLYLLILCSISASAQQRVLGPYLQNADSTSMTVMWETNLATSSVLRYGTTSSLGSTANGSSATGFLLSRIHTVKINGLEPGTKYYYSVNFGNNYSDTLIFRTPPLQSDEASFGLIAMSDMQRDGARPNKFKEIVEDGVLDFAEGLEGEDLPDKLAFLLVPGDLVDIGWIYNSWKDEFFQPGKELFEMVPVYPVLGNHEANTTFFFSYFDLPANGFDGFREHWYYKDYSNTRIICMDSNTGYISANGGLQKQLNWLQELLDDACADPNIDFVFAQMHHPFHSELWIPGNLDY